MDFKTILRMGVAFVLLGALLFLFSGDAAWMGAWGYLTLLLLSMVLVLKGPLRLDPELIAERRARHPDAKQWDRNFIRLTGLLGIAEILVPAMDHRYGWTPPLPGWVMPLGFALTALGTLGLVWAMHTNRFFSTVIRIQNDRGHHVVDTGLYAIVRHPGYAGWSLRTLAAPLLLGSLWAYVVAVVFVLMFALRIVFEERTLRAELPGYDAYMAKVRWRLAPGIW